MPTCKRVASKIKELTAVDPLQRYVVNRNPRNLEAMRIAYKPAGYHLEKPGRRFWHKLEFVSSSRYITARVVHFERGVVLEASTSEWAIKKQLFKTNDTSAYVNLAKVLAQRCLESGLLEMRCDISPVPAGKLEKFIKTVEASGVRLTESEQFQPHQPWDKDRPEKPWEVVE